jgi:hypothetical protein
MNNVGEGYIGPEEAGRSMRLQDCVAGISLASVRHEMLFQFLYVGYVPLKTYSGKLKGSDQLEDLSRDRRYSIKTDV